MQIDCFGPASISVQKVHGRIGGGGNVNVANYLTPLASNLPWPPPQPPLAPIGPS